MSDRRAEIERAIQSADHRGYPCGERGCGVYDCEIAQAAIDALELLDRATKETNDLP